MTITRDEELEAMRLIGRIVADTLRTMIRATRPGMTTAELDAIGATLLDRDGAISAPRACYGFPGATCISVNEEIAHGIPGPRVLAAGDLVNIDVSASLDGYFADTGASFRLAADGPSDAPDRLCRDGHRAMETGIAQVRSGGRLAAIGQAIGRFADRGGYTLVRNLASHGVGRALHEAPAEVATWPTRGDTRRITRGMVLTVEPFLSRGARWAEDTVDGWTLRGSPEIGRASCRERVS